MSSLSSVSGVSAASSQALIASLQAQMVRYSKFANSPDTLASTDYKALQTALQAGNASAAQVALARLQRDSQAAGSGSSTSVGGSSADQEGFNAVA